MNKQVQWFPGHMKKAKNEIEARLKIVDCVIELLDARIPISSRNMALYKLTENKSRLVVLTKADLADTKATESWINYYKNQGFTAIFADLNNENDIKKIIKEAEKCGEGKRQKQIARGMKPQAIRAMIIGIPNVGKSTLINKIAKRHAASVQNKPGHTKSQQWIKVSNQFELLDTPGILQSSYESKDAAVRLALIGSINENVLPIEELADVAYDFLKQNYFENIKNRFGYLSIEDTPLIAFEKIAENRGYLLKGGKDTLKAQKVFLNELKNGVLGRISFERV